MIDPEIELLDDDDAVLNGLMMRLPEGCVAHLTMAADDHGVEPGGLYRAANGREYVALNVEGRVVLALLGARVPL